MRSQHLIESSGRGEMSARRGAGAVASVLACVLATLALLGPLASGAAAAEKGNAQDFDAVEALITALGAGRAEQAMSAIGHGLAMMEAQKRIVATERKLAKEAAAAEAEAEEAAKAPVEEVKDPSE